MANEDQFTATGPAFSDAGFPKAAFSTNRKGTDSIYGVNVQASKCGVYGEAAGFPPDPTSRDPSELSTAKAGLFGIGNDYGVFGRGFTTAGVQGENISAGSGVFGVGLEEANGVAGVSKVKGLEREGHSGTGILGVTEGGDGFGVVGLSVDSLVPTTASSVPHVFIDKERNVAFSGGTPIGKPTKLSSGIGVVGASGSGNGVFGMSTSGFGVEGQSDSGPGGAFSSVKGAQIRLLPKLDAVPHDGQAGDLIVVNGPIDPGEQDPTIGAILHICLISSDFSRNQPATWGRVRFDIVHE